MRRIIIIVLACAVLAFAPAVSAQDYPTRTVTVIVPFPPGGSVDGVARIIVDQLNQTVGPHFIVENRAGGASGNVGANVVAKADPDGYTLLLTASLHVVNPFLYKSVPFDVVKDFTPVTLDRRRPADRLDDAERAGQQSERFFRPRPQGPAEIHLRHHQHRLGQPSGDRAASSARPTSIRWSSPIRAPARR